MSFGKYPKRSAPVVDYVKRLATEIQESRDPFLKKALNPDIIIKLLEGEFTDTDPKNPQGKTREFNHEP